MAGEEMQVTLILDADASPLLARYKAAIEELNALTSRAATPGTGPVTGTSGSQESVAAASARVQAQINELQRAIQGFNIKLPSDVASNLEKLSNGGALSQVAQSLASRTSGKVPIESFFTAAANAPLGDVRTQTFSDAAKTAVAQQTSGAQYGAALNKYLAANQEYIDATVESTIAQAQLTAAIRLRLAGESEGATVIGEYAAAVAAAKAANADIAAQTARQLAETEGYVESLALAKSLHAQENARVQEMLAADEEYITATATAANLRKSIKLQTDAAQRAGVGFPGGQDELISQSAQGKADASYQKAQIDLAAIQQRRADNAARTAAGESTEIDLIVKRKALEEELNAAIAKEVSAQSRAAYESGSQKGDFVQQLQARIASRGEDDFKNPNDYLNLSQFLKSRFLTTAGFAVSGIATYAAFAGIQKMVTDSAALEKILQQIRAEFTALGDGSSFNGFRSGILSISAATGTAASEVAQLALQFKGAFASEGNSQILQQVQSAVELTKVTGISLSEITNNLTATALTYETTVQHVGDVALTLQDQTGTAASETITLISDMAQTALEAGATLEQVGAIGAVAAKYTGQPGSSVAEGLNRILPAIEGKAGQIIQAFQQGAPDQVGKVTDELAKGNTVAVFDEIGKSFNNLSKSQQEYIASLVGSRRDAKTAIEVWSNYAEVIRDVGKAQDSNGRLASSYAALQDTLGQQLERVLSAFKNIGSTLLSLGLSGAVQDLAKAIGVLVSAVSDVFGIFSGLNNLFDNVPAKIISITLAVTALYKALQTVEALGFLGAVKSGAASLPGSAAVGGLLASSASKTGAAAAETTTAEGLILPASVAGAAAADVSSSKGGLISAVKQMGTDFKAAAYDADGNLVAAGAGLKAALVDFSAIITTFLPLVAIASVVVSINDFKEQKQKLDAAQQTYISALGGQTIDQIAAGGGKATADYNKARQPEGSGFIFNPISAFGDAIHNFQVTQHPTAASVSQQLLDERFAQAGAQTLQGLPASVLKSAIDEYNRLNTTKSTFADESPGALTQSPGLTSEDVASVAKKGTKDDTLAKNIIGALGAANARHQGLFDIQAKLLESQDNAIKAANALKSGLTDLPNLQAELAIGIITPEEFAQDADKLLQDSNTVLAKALADHASPQNIQTLLQAQQSIQSAKDQAIGKLLTDVASTKTLINGLGGGSTAATNLQTIQANVSALSLPGAVTASTAPQLAQNVITQQQNLLQFMVANASSGAEAQKILNNGIKIPPQVLSVLNFQQLKNTPDIEKILARAASTLKTNVDNIILEIVTNKDGLQAGLKEVETKLRSAIDDGQKALGGGTLTNFDQFQNVLPGLIGSGVGGTIKPPAPTYSPKDIAAAQDALRQAQAGNDPAAQAAAAQATAADQLKFAVGPIDTANAKAAAAQANTQYVQAVNAIAQAQVAVVQAQANGDPIKVAQAALQAAQLQFAQAQGAAAKLTAYAAEITAQNQFADAIVAIANAQSSLLVAIDTAAGKTVKAAQDSLKNAQTNYRRDLQKFGPSNAAVISDQQKIVEAVANVRNTALQNAEDNINFLLATQKISDGNAIAQLRILDQNTKLTVAQHHQIEEQIHSLQQSLQQNLQFNLPADIGVSLYQARRFDQTGAAAYNDHRHIEINITTNAKLNAKDIADHVTDAINAPPRYGARARTY